MEKEVLEAMEKTQLSLDRGFAVSRWRVSSYEPEPDENRDPLAPDWWTDDVEATQSTLAAMGVDLAAMDAALLAQRDAEQGGT